MIEELLIFLKEINFVLVAVRGVLGGTVGYWASRLWKRYKDSDENNSIEKRQSDIAKALINEAQRLLQELSVVPEAEISEAHRVTEELLADFVDEAEFIVTEAGNPDVLNIQDSSRIISLASKVPIVYLKIKFL